ncbi:unnamed protein product [Scytosiphon promiscuus]
MGRRGKVLSRHGPMNVLSSFILCMTLGRLFFVLRPERLASPSKVEPAFFLMPDLSPGLQHQQQEKGHQTARGSEQWHKHHRKVMVQRGDTVPAELQGVSNRLRGAGLGRSHSSGDPRTSVTSSAGDDGGGMNALRRGKSGWGEGMKALVFTMDSTTERVAKSKEGGAAGEIIVRESLTMALSEAGVEVEVATSDLDFERRADIMDIYHAIIVDLWTWAGKGWRMKPQLEGRQQNIFILDFFGSEEPHANTGVPLEHYLTAFPVPAEQGRTFLGYRVDALRQTEVYTAEAVTKRRQGVIWGKTAASFRGWRVRHLISSLADIVELHSTIAPENASIEHDNIVYHGQLSPEKWHKLLRESKFVIGLGNPLSGPSAVDAVMAGCAYLDPVFSAPVKNIYNSQHPFLAKSVGEPYVCSFEKRNTNAALGCARRALGKDLPPMVPKEFTKEAHAKRVRQIFEPVMVASQPLSYTDIS